MFVYNTASPTFGFDFVLEFFYFKYLKNITPN